MKKFHQIYIDLETKIMEGIYPVGSYLPTEITLTKDYGVSRETIRKAQSLLLEKGYIQKNQGRGAIVLDINKFDISSANLESFDEMHKGSNKGIKTIVLKNKLELPSREITKGLHTSTDEMLAIERLRMINGEAVMLDKDFFVRSVISSLPVQVIQASIYEYIENTLQLTIGYANKIITIEPITEEDKQLLDIVSDTHVLVIRSEVYLDDTRLFQIHESRSRVDQFRFVDFARRKKI